MVVVRWRALISLNKKKKYFSYCIFVLYNFKENVTITLEENNTVEREEEEES